jgi:hypothetical protein
MNRKLITALVALVLLVATLALAACGPATGGAIQATAAPSAEEVTSASFNAEKPTVIVDTFNGNVDVTVGGGTAVKIDVTKRGSGDTPDKAKADLTNIQVAMNQNGNTIHVTAKRTDRVTDAGASGAAVKISVPSGSILDLQTSNGKVTVSGDAADVSVKNTNGPIEVRGATGALDVQATNANVTTSGGSGKLRLATSNGTIDATTTAGGLLDISNANGAVRFSGPLLPKGKNSLRTTNAVVAVTLPAASSFILNAVTTNGKITSDFVVKGTNKNDQQLKGTVGENPLATLNLTNSNGTIELHKGG